MSTHTTTDTSPVGGGDPAGADTPTGEVPATVVPAAPTGADAIRSLRNRPRNTHLAGGFGPLIVGVVLFLLMLWAAPSVAPEHVVERPATTATTTATSAPPAPPTTVTP